MQNLDRIPCKNRRDRKKMLQLTLKHTHRPDKNLYIYIKRKPQTVFKGSDANV